MTTLYEMEQLRRKARDAEAREAAAYEERDRDRRRADERERELKAQVRDLENQRDRLRDALREIQHAAANTESEFRDSIDGLLIQLMQNGGL